MPERTSVRAVVSLVLAILVFLASPAASLFPLLYVDDRAKVSQGGILVVAVCIAPSLLALSARSAIRRDPKLGGDLAAVLAMFFSVMAFVIAMIAFRWGFTCHWTPPR